jgi:leader peptidase (prepilin peptidase)/N-methyltransferase
MADADALAPAVGTAPSRQLRIPLGNRTKLAGAAAALVLGAGSLLRFGPGPDGWIAATFCAVIVVLSLVDVDRHKLPNVILLPATASLAVALAIADPARLPSHLLAAGVAFGLFLALAIIYPPGMGMGDVKLMLLLGIVLGPNVIFAILAGSVAASAAALGVLVLRGRSARKLALPYGPFLALGAVAVLFIAHRPI